MNLFRCMASLIEVGIVVKRVNKRNLNTFHPEKPNIKIGRYRLFP